MTAGDDALHRSLHTASDRLRGRMATQRLDLPFAVCLLNDDLPGVHDNNVVLVTGQVPPAVLLRAVERLAATAGWQHRRIEVDDAAVEQRLRAPLLDAGYELERYVTMVLDAPPPTSPGAAKAAIVDVADQTALSRALLREQPWASGDDLLDQFSRREQLLARHAGARVAVAPTDRPVSRALLLRHGDVVEIDDVATLAEHRERGWSRAVLDRAIAHARETGASDIVLVADVDDWPRRWYARLGFREIGRSAAFVRSPRG
jgi:ribosomal protein S18 acetylase RimI-like enzyme